jgi:hypothetical protein
MNEAADFKSAVSTNFTIEAVIFTIVKQKRPEIFRALQQNKRNLGGAAQSRTGLTGFAIRGITALLPRPKPTQTASN